MKLHPFHIASNMFFRAAAKLRASWRLSFSIDEANLFDGMRTACATTGMLLVGSLFHNPHFAWAAIGAFWTCLADAGGSHRRRFASMAGFTMLSTAAGGAAAFASGIGAPAAAAAILLFSFLAGLSVIYSAPVYQVAVLAATAAVVMVAHPLHRVNDGLPILAVYLVGCLFATFLSFTIWKIRAFAPARSATKLVYARLGALALDNARLILDTHSSPDEWVRHAADLRRLTRSAIEAARQSLSNTPQSNRDDWQTRKNLFHAVTDADAIFGHLIAVSDAAEHALDLRPARQRAVRSLTAIAEVLCRMGNVLGAASAGYPIRLRRRLTALSVHLKDLVPRELSLDLPLTDAAPADANPHPQLPVEPSWLDKAMGIAESALGKLRQNLSTASTGFRHAARLAVATTGTFIIGRTLALPYCYWATMATLLVLQPSIGTTWPRSFDRALGSVIGAGFALVIGAFAHTPLELSLAIFPLICLTIMLRRVNYGLFVTFLTPAFLLVTYFASPASETLYSVARLGNNILGVLLALLASYVLWPKRDADQLKVAVDNAARANLQYLWLSLLASDVPSRECESARRHAGIMSSKLEDTYKLAHFERVRTADMESDLAKIASLLRSIAGAATRLRITVHAPVANRELAAWVASTKDRLVDNAVVRSQPHVWPRAEQMTPLELRIVQQVVRLSILLDAISSASLRPPESSARSS